MLRMLSVCFCSCLILSIRCMLSAAYASSRSALNKNYKPKKVQDVLSSKIAWHKTCVIWFVVACLAVVLMFGQFTGTRTRWKARFALIYQLSRRAETEVSDVTKSEMAGNVRGISFGFGIVYIWLNMFTYGFRG